jgi:probable phosphomutase (TIGR03848 family)
MTTFLLIRHGMTDAVGQYLAGTAPGVHLNALGRQQAEELAWRLNTVPIKALASSPLERALETAKPLARDHALDIEVRPDLNEVEIGEWTGKHFGELSTNPDWIRFNTARSTALPPGGELMIDVQHRAVRVLLDLARRHPDEIVALVSHGDVLRAILLFALGMPIDYYDRVEASPARVSVVTLDGGTPKVLQVNGDSVP